MEFFFLPFFEGEEEEDCIMGEKRGRALGKLSNFQTKKRCTLRSVVRLDIGVCLRVHGSEV